MVEPQMEELFHAPFNAAILHTTALAHPGVRVSFHAFPAHLRVVKEILSQHDATLAGSITWTETPLPSAKGALGRFLETRRFIRRAASLSDRVLFTSISRMQLLHLKRFLHGRKVKVRAVLHGDLDRIGARIKERFPNSLFPLERVLLAPHPRNLRYLVLSDSILRYIPDDFRAALAESAAIDHPYHFPPIAPTPPEHLSFGVFGNSGEGRLLEEVARKVKSINPDARFSLVGFLSGPVPVERLAPYFEGVTDVPIDRETFIRRANGISHALWLSTPDSFRLRASGTFFDALAYGKPLIYTANPYIDPYYEHEPGIGVRCANLDDVPAAILAAVKGFDREEYRRSQQAIARFRQRFTPQEQAKKLPVALDW